MSQQIRGQDSASAQGTIAKVGADGNQNVTLYAPDFGSGGGRNIITTVSGVLTAIAAKTSSAGHLWALQNATATSTKLTLIHRVRARFCVTVAPASSHSQEIGFILSKTTAHTVQPTGGAAVSMLSPEAKKRTSNAAPETAIYYANSTGALTAGTYTINTAPIADERAFIYEAASTPTVALGECVLDRDFGNSPLVLAQNEGLLIANAVLMANSIAGRLNIMVEWSEVSAYNQ